MKLGLAMAAMLLLAGCAAESPQKPAATKPSANAGEPSPSTFFMEAAAKPSAPFEGQGWKSLFDGRTLKGWRITDFTAHGSVHCEHRLLVIGEGDALTGVTWTNDLPSMNYEIALDAMRVQGLDFFCGLTFPVGGTNCSLILSGWSGAVTGLSSIDGADASENETTRAMNFERGRWYRVRVRVTETKIEAWVDAQKIVDVNTQGRQIGLRFGEIDLSRPLGLATYQTRAVMRQIKIRKLGAAEASAN